MQLHSLTSREACPVRIVVYSHRISLSRLQTDGDMGSAPKISYTQERVRKRRQFLKNGNTQLHRISILSITQENCPFSNFVSWFHVQFMIFKFFFRKVQAIELRAIAQCKPVWSCINLNVLSFHWGRKITGLGTHWMILHTTPKILSGASLQKFFDCQNWYSRIQYSFQAVI